MNGRVSSLQSLGTLDGPGIRYVVFMQGCPLRCSCCHNPETHDLLGGTEYSPEQIVENVVKYREYFGQDGGITLSGGEPLLQTEFATQVFKLCKQKGINTCLDTSGCIFDDGVKELLKYTDYCMLDIKYATEELYQKYVGCSIKTPLKFLEYLNEQGIKTRIRQVTVPTINDSVKSIEDLALLLKGKNIEKVELLPFKKICQTKYDSMGLEFPFGNLPSADVKKVSELQVKVNERIEI
ncbi:MAG: pyruvate formate lyase-activating protein [Ruminococcaceae bacterium]|nr:pyruvate formate lyase-activating protein [Oscillospiraceae bacterium]